MGCVCSEHSDNMYDTVEVDCSNLDRFEKVEHAFAPLYKVKIEAFEARVKKFVLGSTSVSL